jgi:hypothetical protein
VEKNSSWRKEYIAFINCIAHVVSLKTLYEKPLNKNSHREQEYNIYLFDNVFLGYSILHDRYWSSWFVHEFQCLANMIYLIFVILLMVYLQGRFNKTMLPLIKPNFELHCSNHTFHKCVLNNGMQYQNTISFKKLTHNSSINYMGINKSNMLHA